MKKLALTALVAAITTVGFASVASANDDDQWRPRHNDDGNRWDNQRGDDHHGRRDHRRNDEWRYGHRQNDWRRHHRPRYVFRDDVCFVKKVRVYDDWGNLYVKHVRVCR